MASTPNRFTLDVVNVPDVVILDAAMPSDQVLKPLMDIVWNGGGWPRSPFYDEATGKVDTAKKVTKGELEAASQSRRPPVDGA